MLMVLCGAAMLAGLAAIARWGGTDVEPPGREVPVASRYFWSVTVAVGAGAAAGLLVGGPGGRLAMRLLAAAAGDGAQGRITEAEEVVGEITTGGTLGFVLFVGLLGGLFTGGLYMLVRRWLPRGRLGGLVFGTLLLVVGATRIEPLRRDNPDFDIVGPGWLALVAFGALILVHGMAVAAFAGRYAQGLRPLSKEWRGQWRHLPLLLLLPLVFPMAVVLAGLVLFAVGNSSQVAPVVRSRRFSVAGRAALAGVALVALPGFVATFVDIAGRGP